MLLSNRANNEIAVALDLGCLLPQPLTGVGNWSLQTTRALLEHTAFDYRLFASSMRSGPAPLEEFAQAGHHTRFYRFPTRVLTALWTRLEWPPIEHFTGPVDIAHGFFHLLPAARHAKRVVTVYDLTVFRFPQSHKPESVRVHRKMLRHAAGAADAIVAASESCKADLVEMLGADAARVHVVHGAVDHAEFEGALDCAALENLKTRLGIEGEFLLYLGTLEPRKNLVRLIEAYSRVDARFRDCPKLVLAGGAGWKFEPVFEAIEALPDPSRVIHTGHLNWSEGVLLLRGALACLYPSLYEGFGLPVLEAMAAGTPVLTSNVSSLPEVIGDTGIQVEPERTESIEAGIVELIEGREEALRRAGAALERSRQFTWERNAKKLSDLYETLVQS